MTKKIKEIQIDGPANLLATVPHLLGFNPEDSLVVVAVKGEQDQVVVTMTLDLPEKIDEDFIKNLAETIKRSGADGLVAIFYLSVDPDTDQELADLFMEKISPDFHIRDILWVRKNKWASYLCDDQTCCPIVGRELVQENSQIKNTDLIMDSKTITTSKTDLEKYLEITETDQELVPFLSQFGKQNAKANHNKSLEKWEKTQFRFLSQRKAFIDYDEKMWARLIFGLTDIPVRDALLSHHIGISQNKKNPNEYLKNIALNWARIAQVAPTSFRAPICACIAAFMWQAGEGILARIAVNFSLAQDPQFHLGKLLSNALNTGMPPWEFRDAFTKITNPWS